MGPGGPLSYVIKSRERTLRPNLVQIQQAPSTDRDGTNSTPSAPVLPDLLVPNTMTDQRSQNSSRGIIKNSKDLAHFRSA